jgi:hypothetical protein
MLPHADGEQSRKNITRDLSLIYQASALETGNYLPL